MIERLSCPSALAITYMLLHSTWQITLIALGYQQLVRAGMVRTANGRYLSGLFALALIIGSALMTVIAVHPGLGDRRTELAFQSADSSQGRETTNRSVQRHGLEKSTDAMDALAHRATDLHLESIGFIDSARPRDGFGLPLLASNAIASVIRHSSPYVIAIWMIGVFCFSGRLLGGFAWLVFIKRSADRIPHELATRSSELAKRIGLPSACVFCSKRIVQAAAVGFFRPMVILPTSWLTSLPPDVLEAVIAHELAHIRRFDLWINLIQRLIEAAFFFHPAVWWLSNQIRLEREVCCDELAIVATGKRCAYAIALETVGRLNVVSPNAFAAPFTGENKMNLLYRVNHVLHAVARTRRNTSWGAGLVAVLLPLAFIVLSDGTTSRRVTAQDQPSAGSEDRRPEPSRSVESDSPRRRSPESQSRDRRSPESDTNSQRRTEGQTQRRRDGDGERDVESPRKPQDFLRGFKPENDRESALLNVITELRQEIAQLRRDGAVRREGSADSRRELQIQDRATQVVVDFEQFQLPERWEKTRDGKVFLAYDHNHDQSISLDEWLAMTNGNISDARRQLQTKRFRDAEPSGDDQFTPREFIYWYSIGRHVSSGREGGGVRESDGRRNSNDLILQRGDSPEPERLRDGESIRRGPRDGEGARPVSRDGDQQ
ncbi:MAG: M48 family metalloprotease [Planctomycetales bacterium]|nr:M48 family metalloprotease [Planctomycetales bacterium]